MLAVAVAPQFVDVQDAAYDAQRDQVAGAIIDGINMKFAKSLMETGSAVFPTDLDLSSNAACSTSNPCFTNVLQQSIIEGWTKTSTNTYVHEKTNTTYYYSFADGSFVVP